MTKLITRKTFLINFTDQEKYPSALDMMFTVQAEDTEMLAVRLAELLDEPVDKVTLLFIDMMDVENHPGNCQLSIDHTYDYYCNIDRVKAYSQ